MLDPGGIAISTAAGDEQSSPRSPSTARTTSSSGRTTALAAQLDIYGARVSPAGRRARPGRDPDLDGGEPADRPALAFDGTNYLVAWEDARGAGADIYGARVSPAGAVLDPGGIAISTAASSH